MIKNKSSFGFAVLVLAILTGYILIVWENWNTCPFEGQVILCCAPVAVFGFGTIFVGVIG